MVLMLNDLVTDNCSASLSVSTDRTALIEVRWRLPSMHRSARWLSIVALAAMGTGCAQSWSNVSPAATVPASPRPIVFLAYATPRSQIHPGDQLKQFPPEVVVFSDGFVIARDSSVIVDDGPPAYRWLTLTAPDVRELLRALDSEQLARIPQGNELPDVGWAGMPDRVISVLADGRLHEVRDLALDGQGASAEFERAVGELQILAGRVVRAGRPWGADELHRLPTVLGGTVIEG